MATTTDNYGLIKPGIDDFYDIGVQNDNWDAVDTALEEHAQQLSPSGEKESPADSDSLILTDSTANGIKKRLSWTGVKTALGKVFAGLQHTHSMEEVDALGAALANKAGIRSGHYAGNIDTLKDSGVWVCIGSSGAIPPGFDNWFTLIAFPGGTGSVIQIACRSVNAGYPNQTCIRHFNGDSWDAWGRVATATPPAVYDLPLAAGVSHHTGGSKYCKTQEGIVLINGRINISAYNYAMILGTLPEGFRPKAECAGAGHGASPTSGRVVVDVGIYPDGSIVAWADATIDYLSFWAWFETA